MLLYRVIPPDKQSCDEKTDICAFLLLAFGPRQVFCAMAYHCSSQSHSMILLMYLPKLSNVNFHNLKPIESILCIFACQVSPNLSIKYFHFAFLHRNFSI